MSGQVAEKMRTRIFKPHNSKCEYCGSVYLKRRAWAKFCSRTCHDSFHSKSNIQSTLARIELKLDHVIQREVK
jgi:hypothetical protein